jgi:hypothetical protein
VGAWVVGVGVGIEVVGAGVVGNGGSRGRCDGRLGCRSRRGHKGSRRRCGCLGEEEEAWALR